MRYKIPPELAPLKKWIRSRPKVPTLSDSMEQMMRQRASREELAKKKELLRQQEADRLMKEQ